MNIACKAAHFIPWRAAGELLAVRPGPMTTSEMPGPSEISGPLQDLQLT